MLALKIAAIPVLVTALGLVAMAVLPTRYAVERSIAIRASKAAAADAVADLSRRTAFVAWVAKDPAARYDHASPAGVPGSSLSFEGEKVGKATIHLVSRADNAIDTRIEFEKPFPMTATDRFVLEDAGGGNVRVRWINSAELSGAGRLFGLFADRVLGVDYEVGLQNLKANLEAAKG